MMQKTVCGYIKKEQLLENGQSVLVAVSGGSDSMALLYLLADLRHEMGLCIHAAHLNHGLRADAAADTAFVETACRTLDIPCTTGFADVPALQKARRMGLEAAAREARYAFLVSTAKSLGIQTIALAHQLEDQAETMLMHAMRGSGLGGLGGIRPVRHADEGIRLIRPLLTIPRDELRAYLVSRGASWREDASNAVADNVRNALRLDVLPRIEGIRAGSIRGFARTSRIAAEENDYLDAAAREQYAACVSPALYGLRISFAALAAMPVVIGRRVLVQALLDMGASPEFRHVEALLAGRGGEVPGGIRAVRFRDVLCLARPHPQPPVLPAAPKLCWMGWQLLLFGLDTHLNAGSLVVRARRDGDIVSTPGGHKKLKKLLLERGVEPPLRDLLPVLAFEHEVLDIALTPPLPARDAGFAAFCMPADEAT